MTSPNSFTAVSSERLEYLRSQEQQFEHAKPSLLAHYLDEFVAFEDGQILDHDLDETALLARVYDTYGYRDILIKQVLQHEPQLSVGGALMASNGD